MKLEVVLEVQNVFGGDGVTRTEQVQQTKVSRTRKTKQTRTDIGIPAGGSELQEQQIEIMDKEVQTFKRDEQGRPILRAGGVHGKLWGALKEAAQQLRVLGIEPFTTGYKSIVNMLNVTPVYIPVETNGSQIETQTLPQMLAGRGGTPAMITMKYDVVPKGVMKFQLSFPDQMQKPVELLVRQLENMGVFNKRRAVVKIASIKEVIN